jgi:cytochrome c biogenesis protein CcmG/thiol:disulfide interchange protein DsbE
MNKRTRAIILGAALAAVITAGSVLYSVLSASYRQGSALSAASSKSSFTDRSSGASESSAVSSASAASSAVTDAGSAADNNAAGSTGSTVNAGGTGGNTASSETITNLAPDFTVYDAAGKAVTLSSFRGKPVVINFWASWCYYCKLEMPDFSAVYQKEKDNVQFLFIDWVGSYPSETPATAAAYLKSQNYPFTSYYDTKNDAVGKYQLTGIPATYYINRKGQLVAGSPGATTKADIESNIAKIK